MIKKCAIMLTACLLAAGAALADALDDLAKYEYGESKAAPEVEKLIKETEPDKYGPIEEKLIAVVSSKDATQAGKAWACRFLQQVGTEKCIPAVAGLLGDEILSHYARLVLERLKCEKADQALCAALAKAPDKVKIGILGSIGVRRCAAATAQAAKLAAGGNHHLAVAALRALGKIGGKEAAKSLLDFEAGEKLVPFHMRAMVKCAENCQDPEATRLCETVMNGPYSPCRIAALRALANANPAKASPMIVKALKGNDVGLRKGAVGIVAGTKGEALTKDVLGVLDTLAGARRAELILALGSRGDKTALPALTKAIKSDDAVVSKAAIKAVGRMGDADTVKLLLGMVDSPGTGAAIASAIVAMTGEDIDAALTDALADTKLRAAAIKALTARGATTAAPGFLKLVEDADAAVRKEAWAGLAALATAKDLDEIMKAVVAVEDEKELSYAESAIKRIVSRAKDKAACFKTISAYYDSAPDATKGVILGMAPVIGDSTALEMERKALGSSNKELAGEALRALAAWPNEAAAEDLLKVAKSGSSEVDRIVALGGYIRIAGLETADIKPAKRVEMFKTALGLAKRDEEKKLVASGLQGAICLDALKTAKELMDNPATKAEAEMSAANLLWNLRTSSPTEVTAMAKELKGSENKTVSDMATKTLADLAETRAYVRAWLMSEFYSGRNYGEVFKKAYPPEKGGGDVKWKRLTKGIGKKVIDLQKAVKNADRCCVYLKTTLVAARDQTVKLEMGSDDGIKAWLNGKLVHENMANRGCSPGADVVKVELKKGENPLMLKVVDDRSHWQVSCRIRQEDGMPVEGLEVKPE